MKYLLLILFLTSCYRPEPILGLQTVYFKAFGEGKSTFVIFSNGYESFEYFQMLDTLEIKREFAIDDLVTFKPISKDWVGILHMTLWQPPFQMVTLECELCASINWRIK